MATPLFPLKPNPFPSLGINQSTANSTTPGIQSNQLQALVNSSFAKPTASIFPKSNISPTSPIPKTTAVAKKVSIPTYSNTASSYTTPVTQKTSTPQTNQGIQSSQSTQANNYGVDTSSINNFNQANPGLQFNQQDASQYYNQQQNQQSNNQQTNAGASNGIDELLKSYLTASAPSQDETDLSNKLAQLQGSTREGVLNLSGQGRGIPLELVRGQQAKLLEQGQIQQQTLQQQLANMQAKRQSSIDVSKTLLSRADTQKQNDREYGLKQAELNKPISLSIGSSALQRQSDGSYSKIDMGNNNGADAYGFTNEDYQNLAAAGIMPNQVNSRNASIMRGYINANSDYNQTDAKTSLAGLQNVVKQGANLAVLEKQATGNIATARQLTSQIGNLNQSFLNAPLNQILSLGSGNPNAVKLGQQLSIVASEMGRIAAGSNVVSESVRAEFNRINANSSPAQILGVLDLFEKDIATKKKAVEDATSEYQSQNKSAFGQSASTKTYSGLKNGGAF